MKYTTYIILCAIIYLFATPTFGQTNINKLKYKLNIAKEDTNKVKLLNDLCDDYSGLNSDSAIAFGEKGLLIAKKSGWDKGIAMINVTLGNIYLSKSEYSKSYTCDSIALNIYKEKADWKMTANVLVNIGTLYNSIGNYPEAIDYQLKSLRIYEQNGKSSDIANSYASLGNIYQNEGDNRKAMHYYEKARELFEKAHSDISFARISGSIANVYYYENQKDSALAAYLMTLQTAQKLGSKGIALIALNTGNIGSLYTDKFEDYSKALIYHYKALKIYSEIKDSDGMARSMGNIGETYFDIAKKWQSINKSDTLIPYSKTNCIDNSIKYLTDGIMICKKIHDPRALVEFYDSLSKAELLNNENYKYVYKDYSASIRIRDSLFNNSNSKQIMERGMKYEFEKEREEAKIKQDKKDEVTRIEIYGTGGFGVAVLVFALVFFSQRNRIKKEKKNSDSLLEKVEKLNVLKDKIFSIISHDLRSPLSQTKYLLDKLGQVNINSTDLEKLSTELAVSYQHNLDLFDNLIYWATNQVRGIAIIKKPVNVYELVEENIYIARSLMENKHISYKTDVAPDMTALADYSMVMLVLRNLMNNAIKYTPEGGEIIIIAVKSEKMIQISVSDTGIGMSNELTGAIFSGTKIESMPGTYKEKGFGIGLKLCKEFVEKNGGEIQAESTPGRGSTFSFTLPVCDGGTVSV